MENSKLEAWFNGDIEDDDLTDAEVKWLEIAVNDAVIRKITERDGVHIFPEAKGLH